MKSLVLRTDATPKLGVGHLSRCVAVATEARSRGWEVALCGTFAAGQWLLKDLPVVKTLPQADVLLTDHYEQQETRPRSLTVSIEDGPFGRRRADIVVDANLYQTPRPDDGSGLVLRGPRYAPLRAEIRAARERRTAGGTPPKVVVVMGGGAAPAAVAAAIEALKETGVEAEITAISATKVPGVEAIAPTPDLPALLATADVVVSAAGVTLLELCCIGVPTALVCIADNQKAGYEAAVTQGLAVGLGTDPREHVETLRSLLQEEEQRNALTQRAMAKVDGRGAERILDAIESTPAHKSAVHAAGRSPIPTLPEGTDNPAFLRSAGKPAAVRSAEKPAAVRSAERPTAPGSAGKPAAWSNADKPTAPGSTDNPAALKSAGKPTPLKSTDNPAASRSIGSSEAPAPTQLHESPFRAPGGPPVSTLLEDTDNSAAPKGTDNPGPPGGHPSGGRPPGNTGGLSASSRLA